MERDIENERLQCFSTSKIIRRVCMGFFHVSTLEMTTNIWFMQKQQYNTIVIPEFGRNSINNLFISILPLHRYMFLCGRGWNLPDKAFSSFYFASHFSCLSLVLLLLLSLSLPALLLSFMMLSWAELYWACNIALNNDWINNKITASIKLCTHLCVRVCAYALLVSRLHNNL